MRSLQLLTILCLFFLIVKPISAKFYTNVSSIPPLQFLNATQNAWETFSKLAGCHVGEKKITGLSKLKQYFHRFGYITTGANFTDDFDDVLQTAINTYQKNFNLKVTGTLDASTLKQIIKPRCGNPDITNGYSEMTAVKKLQTTRRYSFFPGKPRWPKQNRELTYAFVPQNNLTEEVKKVFARAFTRWSDVTPLNFTRSESILRADIVIGFFAGEHGDGEPFDGAMGTLAHASSPPTGMFHLDGDEDWLISEEGEVRRGILPVTTVVDLESVAVHEIGHLLGLGHSSVENAIMYPAIAGGDRKVELAKDDIEGIQHLYGGSSNGDGGSKASRRSETGGGGESGVGRGRRWDGFVFGLSVIATWLFLCCL